MSGVATCLWFATRAEEAARFYVDTFRACGREAALGEVSRYGDWAPDRAGTVLMVTFTLDGAALMALNGEPHHAPSPAVSLVVHCADQAEIDGFWERLSEGGEPGRCGWLTDRFGISWLVVPRGIAEMVSGPASDRVMRAVGMMGKFDLAALRAARDGG